jgi:hypothetical protein
MATLRIHRRNPGPKLILGIDAMGSGFGAGFEPVGQALNIVRIGGVNNGSRTYVKGTTGDHD